MAAVWWESERLSGVKQPNNIVHYKQSRRSISLEDYTKLQQEMNNHNNEIILCKDSLHDLCLMPPSKVDISFNYNSVNNKSRASTPSTSFPDTIRIPTGEVPETRNPPPTPTRKLSLESNDLNPRDIQQEQTLYHPPRTPQSKYKRFKLKRATPVIPKTNADFMELPHTPTKYPTIGNFSGSLLTCRKERSKIPSSKAPEPPPTPQLLRQILDVPDNHLLKEKERTLKIRDKKGARSVSRMIAAGKWDDYNKTRAEQGEITSPNTPQPDLQSKGFSIQPPKVEPSFTPIQHMRQSSAKRRAKTKLQPMPLPTKAENKERNIISPDIRSINYRTSGSMDVLKNLEETLGHMPPSRTPYVYFRHNFTEGDKSQKFVSKWLAAGPTNISFANS